MRITLTHGYMNATTYRLSKEEQEKFYKNSLEFKLKERGWKLSPDRAVKEVNTFSEMMKIFQFLVSVGITGGIIVDGLDHREMKI